MLTGLAALETTDWKKLYHAYGPATDTPHHLLAFLEDDLEAQSEAIEHLFSAIIHQGTPWTATAPTALVVAGMLTDERIHRSEGLHANLLSFLVSVAQAQELLADENTEELRRWATFDIDALLVSEEDYEALFENEDAANSFYARSVLSCIEVAPELMRVMLGGLGDSNPRVRTFAAMGAVKLANTKSLRSFAAEIESRLLTLAQVAKNTDERSALLLALGELGFSPIAFLEDASPAVRMCAALAPSLSTHPAAIEELLKALEYHVATIDDWFIEKPPQFPLRPRFPVVARLIQQVKDFERIANAAIAVIGVTTKLCVDFDWGPLVAVAFPEGDGIVKTESQRRFLSALVRNTDLWDPKFGNPVKWFKKAGLPYDRQHCSKRVGKR